MAAADAPDLEPVRSVIRLTVLAREADLSGRRKLGAHARMVRDVEIYRMRALAALRREGRDIR